METAQHWHAYSWVGHERPADSVRMDPNNPTPPLEVAHWLRKPARHVQQTFPNDEAGAKDALGWMRAGGEEHRHLGEEAFPLDDRLVWTEDALSRGADVVWGYYAQGSRYVSRALIACPRGDGPCPYGS